MNASRSTAIDIARALAIIGVVFNHTVDGLVSAGIVSSDGALAAANEMLYVMRMPALVFLVGLFVAQGVARRGAVGYVAGRSAVLLYLLIVWQAIQGGFELITAPVRNGSTTVFDVVSLWTPIAHLWFLPLLAIITATVVIARPWRAGRLRMLTLPVLAALSVLTWGWNVDVLGLRGFALVGFLAAGALVGLGRMSALLQRRVLVWAAVGAFAVAVFLVLQLLPLQPATVSGTGTLLDHLLSAVAASVGIVALLSLSAVLSKLRWLAPLLAAVGRVTLPIYLAHVIIVAGGRVALELLGMRSPAIAFILVPLGVAAPCLLLWLAGRLGFTWLFVLPAPLARSVARIGGRPGSSGRGVSGTRSAEAPGAAHDDSVMVPREADQRS